MRGVSPAGETVIVKSSAIFPTTASVRARLRREHDICAQLAGAAGAADPQSKLRLPVPVGVHDQETPPHIAFRDDGGTAVSTRLRRGAMPVVDALRLGARVAALLGRVHAAGIIHKDVKPSNLLLDDEGAVTLLDFGISAQLDSEVARIGRFDGSLPYMSPEQSGRVNRPVDARSDLYSLGATLYECLTGRPPFDELDPTEVLHGHLARQPAAPSSLRPGIPVAVDAVVLRLLEKASERRYQTALGVESDLEHLASRLQSGAETAGFRPGNSDRAVRFSLPARLYGRDQELGVLVSAFERAATGRSEFVLVHGWSGVGKTALVAELGRAVAMARGQFVSGKFDQFRRQLPFSGLLHCFAELFQRLLLQSEESVLAWRSRLSEQLGSSAGVLLEILPESRGILGHTSPPESLDPEAARLRLARLVLELLRLFATDDSPLVLFLDDLQWADLGSLELLHTITTGGEIPHLLLVGSYRSNEVDAAHPLAHELARIREARSRGITDVSLLGLSRFRLTEYLADAFGRSPEEVEPLAGIVHEKTAGNPFFVKEFLKYLHKAGHVQLAASNGFSFDLAAIRRGALSQNVVELLLQRIVGYGERPSRTLSAAAALGATFDLHQLAQVVSLDAAGVADDLWPALSEGLLAPLDDEYAVAGMASDATINPAYAFQHDRVQQAAYELTPAEDRPALHLRVAMLLDESKLFERADHFLAASSALGQHREVAAQVLAAAGAAARHSAAYGPGVTYLGAARRLLGGAGWETAPALMGNATMDQATCEYLVGNAATADELFREALEHATSDVDRANSYVLRVALRIGKSQVLEALELAREGLALCGEPLPLEVDGAAVGAAFGALAEAIAGRSYAELAELPEATDPLKLAALEILNDTAAPAYYVNENLYALIILKMCTISARHGQTPVSSFGWALYGVVLGPILGDFAGSREAAVLARRVQARFARPSLESKVALCLCGFVDHWTAPPLDSIPGLEAGVRAGLTAGDPVFATFCTLAMGYLWLNTGLEVGQLASSSSRLLALGNELGIAEAPAVHEVNLRVAEALTSDPSKPLALGSDEASWLAKLDGYALKIPAHMACLARLELGLLFETLLPETLDELVGRSAALLPRSLGTGHHSMHAWLAALVASLRLAQAGDDPDAAAALGAHRTQLEAWAAANPVSFAHKVKGLDALGHLRAGQAVDAITAFDAAIADAVANGFVKNAGLLAELAARGFRKAGLGRLADAYLREAVARHRSAGNTRRLLELEVQHRWLRAPTASSWGSTADRTTGHPSASVATFGTTSTGADLDDWSLVKASQALAGEMRFDALASRLMEVLMESSGAQRSLLLVPERGAGGLEVAVEHRVETGRLPITSPLSARDDVPKGVIQFVSRSHKPVVLSDLSEPGLFADDPYVAAQRTAALCCVAAVHAGRLEAVLYLENGVLPGAFTGERTQVIAVLAGQLAISLANARLFEQVDRQAKAFARFVPREFLAQLRSGRAGDHDLADVRLGEAVRRDMAVLFADLRAYTELSEGMSPEDNFAFVNEYLSRIGPVIRENGGFIDKYIGDAIMALFTGADDAIEAAEGLFARTTELNAIRAQRGEPPLRIGVGLHYGSLMLGLVGEAERLDVTVISDVVNTASRLERLCKFFDARIVASDALLAACRSSDRFSRRFLGHVGVQGRREPVPVYEMLGADPERLRRAKEVGRASFETAVHAVEAGEAATALSLLEPLVAACHEDGGARAWLTAARSGRSALSAPKE